jgi:hypothetical protein
MWYNKDIVRIITRYLYAIINKFLFLILLTAVPLLALSQKTNTCAENLKNAQSLFDKGQVEQVPSMLHNCLKSGFKREEELAAYKLIIQSYLFEDKLEQADSTMLAFLKKNPEYQLSPTDHSSFVFLYNTFTVKPVVQISFHFGTNIPFVTFINPVTVSSEHGKSTYFTRALNLYTSLEAKFAINSKLELNIEGGFFSQISFSNVEKFRGLGNTLYKETRYEETQQRIEIPLTATYNIIKTGRFTTYARAGIGAALDIASSAQVSEVSLDINNFETHTGPDVVRNRSRRFIDLFAQVGAGIKFKTPGGYMNLEVRSNFGMLNQAVRAGSSPETLRWDYSYVDDDFRLNNMNINIGYTQIFYKPSKRK